VSFVWFLFKPDERLLLPKRHHVPSFAVRILTLDVVVIAGG
jgi:hypothetical protein